MARLGRGQPHAAIFIRNSAVIVAAALAPKVHVIQAARRQLPPPTHIIIQRGNSTVPLALAPKLHITLTTRRNNGARVRDFSQIIVAGRKSTVPLRLAPQINVTLQTRRNSGARVRDFSGVIVAGRKSTVPVRLPAEPVVVQQRLQRPRPGGRVTIVRTAVTPPSATGVQPHVVQARRAAPTARKSIFTARGASWTPAPQLHVVTAPARRLLRTTVVVYRTAAPPAAAPAAKAAPSHVVLVPAPLRQPRAPIFLHVRPASSGPIPGGPQVHVQLWSPRRPRPVGAVVSVRNALVPPPPPVAPGPQIHVTLWSPRRPRPIGLTLVQRAPVAPLPPPAKQVNVTLWSPRRPLSVGSVVSVRTKLPAPPPQQPHVVLWSPRRPRPVGFVLISRAPVIPPPRFTGIHVTLWAPRGPRPTGHVIQARNPAAQVYRRAAPIIVLLQQRPKPSIFWRNNILLLRTTPSPIHIGYWIVNAQDSFPGQTGSADFPVNLGVASFPTQTGVD